MASHDNSNEIYRAIREQLAAHRLLPVFAKLYSQHTLLNNAQPSLPSWQQSETNARLQDAVRLISIALTEREAGALAWQQGAKRAGELLEWLSHEQMNQAGLPLPLLSSAAYQLGGYPARALGVLNQLRASDTASLVLRDFLMADFRTLLDRLATYWEEQPTMVLHEPLPWHDEASLSIAFRSWIIGETFGALGVLCSYMRWGDEARVETAKRKLKAVADVLLHDQDPYSWLIASLCAEISDEYQRASLRRVLIPLLESLPNAGRQAFENYMRFNYNSTKSLTWPSQALGIERIRLNESFALCTPTGSGKTTVAEIAILNALFRDRTSRSYDVASDNEPSRAKPMAIYLVPSKALATEVEAKLERVLSSLAEDRIIVTGLYGGNDWGPTDAWLTSLDRVVLICTYEKAEALLRFLSPLFLDRVAVVVVDEAHNVQFNLDDISKLSRNESRSLRLESLLARMLAYVENSELQCIALSAVAHGFSTVLANWISDSGNSTAVESVYQSTRKILGSLDCYEDGRTRIQYDLLDGWNLDFGVAGRSERPYVPNPFPVCPIPEGWGNGPEKRLRPYLFWAAIHLAAADADNRRHSVLIAVMQHIGGYADDFLLLLNQAWRHLHLPQFFLPPSSPQKYQLWQQCLASCADYFTTDSREYQLLQKGIVVHHGRMPGLLARLLIQLIEEQVVNIVLATSTLSEGVNLPFETILIPSLLRDGSLLKPTEFNNLIGRAGRPGHGTEGRSLVVLPAPSQVTRDQVRDRYRDIIRQTEVRENNRSSRTNAQSPLATLLSHMRAIWQRLTNMNSDAAFMNWLERTILSPQVNPPSGDEAEVIGLLDTLDGILLSAIVELEQTSSIDIDQSALEQRLQEIWRRTYAHFVSQEEERLRTFFLHRGAAVQSTIYPNKTLRRRIYRTGLRPMAGLQLLEIYAPLRRHMEVGLDYADWTDSEKLQYISEIVRQISSVPDFAMPAKIGRRSGEWRNVLTWWLYRHGATQVPNRESVSDWHKYVSTNFQYRFNWALGSIVALAMDDAYGGVLRLPDLDDWPLTGLPWIVFWIKELIVWGTLDPVAAYLLSHKQEYTRSDAEQAAQGYYRVYGSANADERLKATNVRAWIDQRLLSHEASNPDWLRLKTQVQLLRDFSNMPWKQWRVIPIEHENELYWLDPAGYPLAKSNKPQDWVQDRLHLEDFFLNPSEMTVVSAPYLGR